MTELRCPTCNVKFDSQHSPALPFCSPQCRDIDLARWMDERIGLPIEREDDSREEPSPPDDPEPP
jgi:uncharacterized protein